MSALVAVCNRPALLTQWPKLNPSADHESSLILTIFQVHFFVYATLSLSSPASCARGDHPRPLAEIVPQALTGFYPKARLTQEVEHSLGLICSSLE
jgi:hypothetical protein